MEKTVLIADDAMFIRVSLKKILENAGYKVVAEAQTGEEAVERYKKNLPDLVTMDITMPDMDGIEALEKIMQINPEAKVVMISAVGYQQNVLKAIQKGAKNFVVKPFTGEKVLEIIDPLMGRS